jgi:hypothetical protein
MDFPDQFHDPGYGNLRALLQAHPAAYEFTKEAALDEDDGDLPDSAFAWESERRYPIHEPQQAVLSALYTKIASKTVPPDVLMKIAEALQIYGVSDLIRDAAVKVAAEETAPEEYIFPGQQLYRVKTAEDLHQAEQRLLSQVPKMLSATRAAAFTGLYKRAVALGQPLQDSRSYQYAGMVQTDLRDLKDQLRARGSATKVAGAREAFDKLAEVVMGYPRLLSDRPVQVKLAQTIADLDSKAGLEPLYDRSLPDPLALVFNTDRRVKTGEQMIELGGEQFPLTQLAGMPATFYSDVLGPDFLEQIQTAPGGNADPEMLATVLPTLPMDMKQLLAQKLQEVMG